MMAGPKSKELISSYSIPVGGGREGVKGLKLVQ